MYKAYKKTRMEEEMFLDFPRKLFKNPFGFTMDFGGSAVKMLYTSEVEDKIRVHFVTYSREDHTEAFQMLEDKCKGRLAPGSDVHTCGLGGSEYHDLLAEKFGLNFVNTNEIDRMVEGFQFLSNQMSWNDFVKPINETVVAQSSLVASGNKMLMEMMLESKFKIPSFGVLNKYNSSDPGERVHQVEYPLLIFLIGSGGGVMKVEADGTYEFCDSSTMAGRAFLGLGSLLTDGKGFTEICDLAGKGDQSKVDIMAGQFDVNPDDKVYGLLKDVKETADMKIFSFGHAVGKDRSDFKQEDISKSLISFFAESFASRAYMWATIHDVKQVFFVGGFPSTNSLIQDEITKFFNLKKFTAHENHDCDCYFLKYGQHFGSFGTLMMNLVENKEI